MGEVKGYMEMPKSMVKDKGAYMEFLHPGLTMADFDRSDNICPWMVAKIFQLSRGCAFSHPEYFSHQIRLYHPDGPMGWTTICQYDFSKEIYSRADKKRFNFPMTLSTRLAKIGKTSLDFLSQIRDREDDVELATLRFKYVLVDRQTRKSTNVPDDFKENMKQYTVPKLAVDNVKFPKRPPSSFAMPHQIRPSNVDFNGHVNNTYYLLLCYDCATVASFNHKVLNKFQGDICSYLTKSIMAQYVGESRLHDEQLTVYCWEGEEQGLVLYFTIENKSGRVIFRNKMCFYENLSVVQSKL